MANPLAIYTLQPQTPTVTCTHTFSYNTPQSNQILKQ